MNKVSIVVPVYNAEKTLKQCVDSLIGQTYPEVEVILVDDGSKDASPKMCDEYAAQSEKVTVFHNENMGPSKTRTFGIQKATGEYLVFCDSDDYMELGAVEKMVATLEENDLDLVLCAYGRFRDGENEDFKTNIALEEPLHIMTGKRELAQFMMNPATSLAAISIWAKLYRLSIIRKFNVEFPDGITYEEDCVFNLQYYRHMRKPGYLSDVFYHWRQNEFSLSKGYRPTVFRDAVNGYNERKKFFGELKLPTGKLDVIFFMSAVNNYNKIAASDLSGKEKIEAYRDMMSYPELQAVVAKKQKYKKFMTGKMAECTRKNRPASLHRWMKLWKFVQKFA